MNGPQPAAGPAVPVRVWRDPADVVDLGARPVVAIGVFDGVHRGHRRLLAAAARIARSLSAPLVVVSFAPHPMSVVRPDAAPVLLATLAHRADLLGSCGASAVRLLRFDQSLAARSPQEFIDSVLVAELAAQHVVVGANFRFGHRAAGTVQTLLRAGPAAGFAVSEVDLDSSGQRDPGTAWSSSLIRRLVADGDMAGAAAGLGRWHRVEGLVVAGDRRGRELGFPTANLLAQEADYAGLPAVPADGVYAGWLHAGAAAGGSGPLAAAVSVGSNPTFPGARSRRVEAYALDRTDLDLYGAPVAVDFVARLRGMVAFASVDALVSAMQADVAQTRALLHPTHPRIGY